MKSQSFISKIDILVHWEDRHYGSQYRRSLFVMEKSGFVLLLLYFSCCSISIDIFRLQSRSAGCAALLEVGEVACVCVCVCVCGSGAENPISNSSAPNSADLPRGDWLPLPGAGWATGGVTAILQAPCFGFQMGSSPEQPSCCLLSVSPVASFTDKWAAAPPYGPLMVQLPQQTSALRAEGKAWHTKTTHCLFARLPGA